MKALEWGGWSMPCPGHLPPGKRPGTHFMGVWVGQGVGLDGYGKSWPHDYCAL
jgi:hypothetical protein